MNCHSDVPLSIPPLPETHTHMHCYLFTLDSVAVPTSSSLFSLEGPSQTFPAIMLSSELLFREFPINPPPQKKKDNRLHTEGPLRLWGEPRTNRGGALPRAPCLTPTLPIGYHSTATWGTVSQGPGFLGSLERFDLYKESGGPSPVSMGVFL